jgi:hypothetical protein
MANTGNNSKVSTIIKRDPQFENFRNFYFDEVGQDRASLFNFFLENNDIFDAVSKDDEDLLNAQYLSYANRTFNWTMGSLAGVLFMDKVVMKYAFPSFHIKNLRGLVWLTKYIGVPLASYGLCKYYFCQDIEKSFQEAVDKYNFGFEDYNKAMDILEKAHKVNRLDELLDQGKKFDWSTVPGGKPAPQS